MSLGFICIIAISTPDISLKKFRGPNCPTCYGQAVHITQIGSDTSLRLGYQVTIKRWMLNHGTKSKHRGNEQTLHVWVCQSRRTTPHLATKGTNVESEKCNKWKVPMHLNSTQNHQQSPSNMQKMETASANGLIYQFSGRAWDKHGLSADGSGLVLLLGI